MGKSYLVWTVEMGDCGNNWWGRQGEVVVGGTNRWQWWWIQRKSRFGFKIAFWLTVLKVWLCKWSLIWNFQFVAVFTYVASKSYDKIPNTPERLTKPLRSTNLEAVSKTAANKPSWYQIFFVVSHSNICQSVVCQKENTVIRKKG